MFGTLQFAGMGRGWNNLDATAFQNKAASALPGQICGAQTGQGRDKRGKGGTRAKQLWGWGGASSRASSAGVLACLTLLKVLELVS